MRNLVFIVFLITSLQSYSQIQCTIIGSKSKAAIEGAIVQYGDAQADYAVSDIKGIVNIPNSYNTVFHIYCIGYKQTSVLASKLSDNSVIELELSPLELNEVVINYIDASKLLEIAYSNTIKKLLSNVILNYSAYIVVSYNDDIDEINLEYTSLLKSNKLKKGKIPYELSLVKIDHVREGEVDLKKKNIINCEFHASEKLLNPKLLKDFQTTISYSNNDSLLILKSNPKITNNTINSRTYHINRSDTTIRLIDVKYNDPELTKKKIITYNGEKNIQYMLRGQTGQVELKYNEDNKLYMHILKHIVDCVVRYESGEEVNITYYIDNKYSNKKNNGNKIKQKKLNGFTFNALSLLYKIK